MTVAKNSQPELSSEDLESSVSGLGSQERRADDELESDVDHKEMIRTYACDAYLSRWLPSIKDEQILDGPNMSSQVEERKPVEIPKERRGTTSQQSETHLKSPLKHQEADVSHENGRKTYFEAIKCSPMKLRQSIALHKRPKIEDSLVMKPHHTNQAEEIAPTAKSQGDSCAPEMEQPERLTTKHFQEKTMPTAKSQMSPCVVEMTKDALGQLGSLSFQAKNPDRRRSEVVYTSCPITGGKIRRIHRNSTNTITGGKNNNELLVPCESIMIYPKVLVSPRSEKALAKALAKPVQRKEAWREDGLGASVLGKNNPDAKLPELEPKESVALLDEKCEQKESPEFVKHSKEKQRANSQNSQTSASTKIIIPFGEDESKLVNEGKLERLASQKEEFLLTKSFHDTSVSFKDKNSKKKRGACFPENQKGRYTNFPKKSARKISGIVVGVSQLEISCKTPLVTQSMMPSIASSPMKRFRIRTEDASELTLGRETNPSTKKTAPRFSYGQRTRPDFCGTAKRSSVMTDDQEGYKYFLNTDGILSLKIGGTGLLKEQKSSQEDLGGEKHTDEVDKKRSVHFNTLVPHSRYFT